MKPVPVRPSAARDALPTRPGRRRARNRPTVEALEGRALMAVGFTELAIPAPPSFVTAPDGDFWYPSTALGDRITRIAGGVSTEFTVPSHFYIDGVTNGPDGNVWFTEWGVSPTDSTVEVGKIGRITPAGTITEFALPKESNPVFEKLAGDITTGPGGDVWFVENLTSSTGQKTPSLLARITPAGQITEFNAPGAGPAVIAFDQATRIAGGSDGDLWYTEPGIGAIGRITDAGAVTQFPVPGNLPATDITSGPDGNLWFTEANGVGRATTAGSIRLFAASDVNFFSGRISPGPDGNVWFTEGDGLASVTPTGAVAEYYAPVTQGTPALIGLGPAHSLLFTYSYHDDSLGLVTTNSAVPQPIVTATPETSPRYEALATEVAHFTSPDPLATLADYKAVVHWTNDDSAQGIIRPDPSGGFDVYVSTNGAPATNAPGRYAATVSVFDLRSGGAAIGTATGTLVITPGVDPSSVLDIAPSVATGAGGAAVGTASILEDGTLPASSYTATIDFGDGTAASAATVTASTMLYHPDPGFSYDATTFKATAGHHYAHPGVYTMTVSFRDKSGNTLANDVLVFDE